MIREGLLPYKTRVETERESGYTLVELVVVIAVSAVLVASALAGLGNRNDLTRFSAQVEDIKTAIRQAQNEAASGRGDSVPVGQELFATRISFSTQDFTVYRLVKGTGNWAVVGTTRLPDDVTLTPGWSNATLVFTAPYERNPSVAAFTRLSNDPAFYDPGNRSIRETVTMEVRSRRGHEAVITYDAWGGRLSSRIIQ